MDGSSLLLAARGAALALLLGACAAPPDARAVGGVADVQVYDRSAGTLLPTYWHDGTPYVVGRPGDEYEIRVRNLTRGDLLAVVSVDGVNGVTGETASLHQSGYVVDAWGGATVRGWRKSLAQTAAFYFTSLGDSYAARTGRPADVGVIGLALFARKPRAITTPLQVAPPEAKDEMGSRRDQAARASASPRLGTGHGQREDSYAEYVPFERASDTPVETVTIRYDSYRNLVAQGVIPAYGDSRRHPRAFPGEFVQDP
jgi:hypothetical protein